MKNNKIKTFMLESDRNFTIWSSPNINRNFRLWDDSSIDFLIEKSVLKKEDILAKYIKFEYSIFTHKHIISKDLIDDIVISIEKYNFLNYNEYYNLKYVLDNLYEKSIDDIDINTVMLFQIKKTFKSH